MTKQDMSRLITEAASRLLEIEEAEPTAALQWLVNVAEIAKRNKSAARMYLEMQACGQSWRCIAAIARREGVSRQAMHERARRNMAVIRKLFPDLAKQMGEIKPDRSRKATPTVVVSMETCSQEARQSMAWHDPVYDDGDKSGKYFYQF